MIDDIKALRADLLIGLTLVLPSIAAADPNEKSAADVGACLEGSQTAQVCSTKELSNVVVQCTVGEGGSTFVKYDDLDALEIPLEGDGFALASPFQGEFSCPEGSDLVAVFVKSGSGKYSGPAIDDLPRGSGTLILSLGTCPVACPTDGGEETPPPEEIPPSEETPPPEENLSGN